jgi:hypothetical protein
MTLGLLAFAPSASACEPSQPNHIGNVACSPFDAFEQAGEDRECYNHPDPRECVFAAVRVVSAVSNPVVLAAVCPIDGGSIMYCYFD